MNDVLAGLGERTVTVKRLDLLEKLKSNRIKHEKDYLDAVSGYKAQAKERLEKLKTKILKAANDNFEVIALKIEQFNPNAENPLSNSISLINETHFTLEVPKSHTRSYDIAIQMAEWEVNDTIELTQAQFQSFVLDDWEWRAKFDLIKSTYSR